MKQRWIVLSLFSLLLIPFWIDQASATVSDWTVELRAEGQPADPTRPLVTSQAFIGTVSGAFDGYDSDRDVIQAPLAPVESLRLGVRHSSADPLQPAFPNRFLDLYGRDFRSPIDPQRVKIWQPIIVQKTTDIKTVTLRWNLQEVPPEISLTLLELDTSLNPADVNQDGKTEYDLKTVSSVTVASGAFFALRAVNTTPAVLFTAAPTVSEVTFNSAKVSWKTDRPADGKVEFGTSVSALTQTAQETGPPTTDHTVVLTDLQPGAQYFFRVRSSAAGVADGVSDVLSFQTELQPILVSNVSVASVTSTSAVVTWATDLASDSRVEYGTSAANLNLSATDAQVVTSHRVELKGLTPGTEYFLRVVSSIPGRARGASDILSFKTLGLIKITDGPSVTGVGANRVTLTWTTDVPSDSTVEVGTDEQTIVAKVTSADLVTTHTVTVTDLKPDTAYVARVSSTALGFETVTSAFVSFRTGANPILITSGPEVSVLSSTSALVIWKTDVPSDSLVEFGTDTTPKGSSRTTDLVLEHRVLLTGLQPKTNYFLRVTSGGVEKRSPVTSAAVTFATPGALKIVEGPQITTTATSATLSWKTDQPASTEVEWGTDAKLGQTAGDPKATETEHTVTLVNLTPGTNYVARVVSRAEGLEVAQSDLLFFSTKAGVRLVSPPALKDLQPTQVTVVWTTEQFAKPSVEYGTEAKLDKKVEGPIGTEHSLTITGLEPGVTYRFRTVSTSPGLEPAITEPQEFTTPLIPVKITKGPQAINITATEATIIWSTDVKSDSTVHYGLDETFGLSEKVDELVTEHIVTLKNLKPNTEYKYQVISTGPGLDPVTSEILSFKTAPPAVKITAGPSAIGITANSAIIVWETDILSDSVVEFGSTQKLGLKVSDARLVTRHRVVITGLSPGTGYFYRVISSVEGAQPAESAIASFTTRAPGRNFTFIGGNNVIDIANDNTGTITSQDHDLFAATVGQERDIAVDPQRGILYVARGAVTNEDGRANGQRGIAAIRLVPLSKSVNPKAGDAVSNFIDTGLITAPDPGLGFVQGIYFDPVSDALYVLASDSDRPSATPKVYRAKGGTLGGAPEGGDTSAANPALEFLFQVTDDAGPNKRPLGGTNRGIAVLTKGEVTTVYLAMGQHADVWSNAGGDWHRVWSSDLFPEGDRADQKLQPTSSAVNGVTVDEDGNSYWNVRDSVSARIWQFPANASGVGLGFTDKALGGASVGVGRPVIIENDETVISKANLSRPTNVEYVREGENRLLFVSLLGSAPEARSIARIKLLSDPNAPGDSLRARLIDGFGPGARVEQDSVLATLRNKAPKTAEGKKVTQPAGDTLELLYTTAVPQANILWVNGFITDTTKGQSIPTAAAFNVAYSTMPNRVFMTKTPEVKATTTTATITWSTEQETDNNVVVFGTQSPPDQVAPAAPGGKDHQITLTGLKPDTLYYLVVSSGGRGLDTASFSTTFRTAKGPLPGDVDGNGRVTVADATLALRIALRIITGTPDQVQAADVAPKGKPDGRVSVADVTLILRAALGLETLP